MSRASARRWWLRGLLAAAVLLSAVLLPAYWTRHVLRRDYLDHLFILQHDYVYKVSMATGASNVSFVLVKNADNQFDLWEPGMAVNRAVTAAFMLDGSGLSITSRYATEPWNNDADVSAIKRLISAETGVTEDGIRVSGTTAKLTLQSASHSAQGNSLQMNCVVYDAHEDGKEVRYVGRAENGPPIPISEIDIGDTYLNNLEKGKPLYALAYLNSASGFPFGMQVIDLSIQNYDDMASSTIFEKSASSIPEGAPVFDKSRNLVGVFTSASPGGQANYISNLLRHPSGPSGALKATLDDALQNVVRSIPPALPDDVAFPAEASWSGTVTLDFDSITPTGCVDATSYLGGFGVTVSQQSAGTTVSAGAAGDCFHGDVVVPSSPNALYVVNNEPVSFSLNFDRALRGVSFTRARLNPGTSGVNTVGWSVTAYNSEGTQVAQTGEGRASAYGTDFIAAAPFTLSGADIRSLTFVRTIPAGQNTELGVSFAVLDDFMLVE